MTKKNEWTVKSSAIFGMSWQTTLQFLPTDPIIISVPERKVEVELRQDRELDPLLEVPSE